MVTLRHWVDYKNIQDWLKTHNNHIFQSSVFLKGTLLSIIPAISELITPTFLLNIKSYKLAIKNITI